MGERYWITGVQLGMLKAFAQMNDPDKDQDLDNILEEVIENQFMGNSKDMKDLKRTFSAPKKLKIEAVAVINENNPEFFSELLKKGVDAVEPEMKKQLEATKLNKSEIDKIKEKTEQITMDKGISKEEASGYNYRGGRPTGKDKAIVQDVVMPNKVSPMSDEAHEYVGQKQNSGGGGERPPKDIHSTKNVRGCRKVILKEGLATGHPDCGFMCGNLYANDLFLCEDCEKLNKNKIHSPELKTVEMPSRFNAKREESVLQTQGDLNTDKAQDIHSTNKNLLDKDYDIDDVTTKEESFNVQDGGNKLEDAR